MKNYKTLVVIVIMATIITTGVFGQEEATKNWLSGSAEIIFGFGVQYERMLTPHFSVGAEAYMGTFFFFGNAGLEAFGRWYPWKGTFFAGIGFGYGVEYSMWEDFGGKYDRVISKGFLLEPNVGWRIDVGAKGGFFLEPYLSIPLRIGHETKWEYTPDRDDAKDVGTTGVAVACRISFRMGYSW